MFEGLMQPTHLILILAVAMLVMGPGKLPEIARSLGKASNEYKKATTGIQKQVLDMMSPEPPLPASSNTGYSVVVVNDNGQNDRNTRVTEEVDNRPHPSSIDDIGDKAEKS